MDPSTKLSASLQGADLGHEGTSKVAGDHLDMRRVVGALIFLTNTRHDLRFAVGQLARFAAKPTRQHKVACMYVLRYLRTTMDLGMTMGKGPAELRNFVGDSFCAGVECRLARTRNVL